MPLSALDVSLLGVGVYILQRYLLQPKTPAPLPPGPKGLPIIGNVADMPKEREWVTFAEWGRKWGGICSVQLMGRAMIIVNSHKVMDELDRKGAIYSDRPRLEMGGELVGYAQTLVLIPYGARFRTFRKHFARLIGGSGPVEEHMEMIEHENLRSLKRILADPDNLLAHLRKLAGGIILSLTYGIEVQDDDDPFVNLIESANENFNAATVPGAFMVDFFPSLLLLPEWLPGMSFKALARTWAKATQAMVDVPYTYTKKQMSSGTALDSFVSRLTENEEKMTPDEIRDVKFAASSMYGGGADTTVSAEYAFFLAMVLNPEVLQKGQAELDAVVGTDRLPKYSDRPDLPYVNAIVTEVLRWNSVAPTGVPHTSMEDGVIAGYFIPKNSIIVANLWNMLHDPEVYPDPFQFDPSRHISTPGKEAQRDPRNVCFGYGRRICPGMHLAEASLFLTIAMSLSVFDIKKKVENGIAITPVHENTSGIISYPKAFKCTIEPRSEKAIALIVSQKDSSSL